MSTEKPNPKYPELIKTRQPGDRVLNFSCISPEVAHGEQPHPLTLPAESLQLLTTLESYNQQINDLVARLKNNQTEISDVLNAQNNKLTLLSHLLLTAQSDNKHNGQNIEITVNGLTFKTQSAVTPGRFINLELFNLASGLNLVAFAQVLRCDQQSDSHFLLTTRFHRLSPEQQSVVNKL